MSLLDRPRLGSTQWLLRHELRLTWRGSGQRGWVLLAVLMCVGSLLLHAGAYVVLRKWPTGELPATAFPTAGVLVWLCFSFMLSQAILQSVSALFVRGDLDLLLSSPLPTRSVFMARGLGIAVSVGSTYLFLLAPAANAGLFTGHAELLAVYLAVPALALGATALAMWLTLALVRVLGARRARIAAQVFGSLTGALLFLVTQSTNLLSADTKQHWVDLLRHWAQPGGALASDSPVWWPARALLGEPLPLLAVLLIGAGGFWAVVQLTQRRFLEGTQEVVTGSARRGAKAPNAGSVRFQRSLWRNVLMKEWRMILRDPQLISQTLLQLLYLLPVLWMALRRGQPFLLAPAAIGLATMLTSSIAWITVAAEDAPELLGSSPTSLTWLRWFKVLAALIPVWLIVSPMLIAVSRAGPWPALVFIVCLAGGTLSVGAAQVWYPRQGKRADMKTRGKGALAVNLIEMTLAVSWAGTAYCLNAALPYTPLPLGAALLASAAVWMLGRTRREGGDF